MEFIPTIRNNVRAIIQRDGQILLLRKRGINGNNRYALPGGGQNVGETLEDALQRECEEEIAAELVNHQLVCIAEFFRNKTEPQGALKHLVEFLFSCEISADYIPQNGPHPDKTQLDVVWMPINRLAELQLSPSYLSDQLTNLLSPNQTPLYLGLFHDHSIS